MNYQIRPPAETDLPALLALYRQVATKPGGIIRQLPEVTDGYVRGFWEQSTARGLILAAFGPDGAAWGEIHAYAYPLAALAHNLTELTIVVAPARQGLGLGKELFLRFLAEVEARFTHILRVELFVRQANTKARRFYRGLGFADEGVHYHKIRNADGHLESPVQMTWFNPGYQLGAVSPQMA
jgi:ribosomal protein S18 acetylase RimI-like enzyme